jgi:hypothetical protein
MTVADAITVRVLRAELVAIGRIRLEADVEVDAGSDLTLVIRKIRLVGTRGGSTFIGFPRRQDAGGELLELFTLKGERGNRIREALREGLQAAAEKLEQSTQTVEDSNVKG